MLRIDVPIENEYGVSDRWSVGFDKERVLPCGQACFGDFKAEEVSISTRQQRRDGQNGAGEASKIVRFENAVVGFGFTAARNEKGVVLNGAFDAIDSNLIGSASQRDFKDSILGGADVGALTVKQKGTNPVSALLALGKHVESRTVVRHVERVPVQLAGIAEFSRDGDSRERLGESPQEHGIRLRNKGEHHPTQQEDDHGGHNALGLHQDLLRAWSLHHDASCRPSQLSKAEPL